MHPRNIYNNPPNFDTLAALYPEFASHYRPTTNCDTEKTATTSTTATSTDTTTTTNTNTKKRKRIDFHNPAALKCLTKTLLHHDFHLEWDIPLNRLCPTLTVRLNYLHWIEDLLRLVPPPTTALLPPPTTAPPPPPTSPRTAPFPPVHGLDIGTGASVIYPLLGCQMHPQWQFTATEVDAESLHIAQQNIHRNQLQDRIQVLHVVNPLSTPILQPLQHHSYSFTMCNPPFFELTKILPADTAAGQSATASETITQGGEVAFVTQMVEESREWSQQCIWFTSMFGKKSSWKQVHAKLKTVKSVQSIQTTRLVQGHTSRWAIAWSFVAGVGSGDGSGTEKSSALYAYMYVMYVMHP